MRLGIFDFGFYRHDAGVKAGHRVAVTIDVDDFRQVIGPIGAATAGTAFILPIEVPRGRNRRSGRS